MLEYANPKRFMDVSGVVWPWLAISAAFLIAIGLYLGLFTSPPDYQQGDTVRIMFVHVPAAWIAMMAYAAMAGASLLGFVNRHPIADVAAKTAAPLGALFTALALVTGSLWGRPMWGTYWAWDARLTSFLILLLLYLGYIALWNAIEDETRAARAAAVLALVGAVDVVVVKVSVDCRSGWQQSLHLCFNTLHQGESIFRAGGPLIAPVFLWPLFLMALGYTLLFLTLWIVRMRTEILTRRGRTLLARQVATR